MNDTQQCTGTTSKGTPCPNTLTRFYAEVDGYRCRHHVPDGAEPFSPAKTEPEAPPEPVSDLPPIMRAPKSMKDIRKLASWALIQVALGRMSEDRAKTIGQLCRETRAALGDERLKNELDKAKRDMVEIKKRQKREQSDDEEGTD